MLNLVKDMVSSLAIYALIMVGLFMVYGASWAEILYDPHPDSYRPDIYQPRIYIDNQGKAYETYEGTFRPDRTKPLVGAPRPPEPQPLPQEDMYEH